MFCRQCEQTSKGVACTSYGVCGKDPETSDLQDILIHNLKGLAFLGKKLNDYGVTSKEVDLFIIEGLFSTVTNVNFDPQKLGKIISESQAIKERVKKLFLTEYKKKEGTDFTDKFPEAVDFIPGATLDEIANQAKAIGIVSVPGSDENIKSLKELLLYTLKGMAAYADHAHILGKTDESVTSFFYKGLASLIDDSLTLDDYLTLVMEAGQANLRCMEILDEAHTKLLGNPVPTEVSLAIKKGPAIIISGHDLQDLKQLLEQTKDKGINIYTHCEMLSAHGYPELKKYKHLVGHFGGAWQEQQKEFDGIDAVILMTTNCIQKPKDSYKDRLFTTGLVVWPGVKHIEAIAGDKDFTPVIEKSLELGGFKEEIPGKNIMVGFAHNAVLGVADKIVEAVKSGAIKHFFLVGGCDGAKPGRNYFTEFVQKIPQDCMILTLACGKFRFNTLDLGSIGDFPRLLDCGQCNDAYSAIKIVLGLADAFNCSVNDLPLSIVLSWYEQKAVCILTTLLSLGIKNIRLGPTLPAFISEDVLGVLVDKFAIKPITTPEKDLKDILGEKCAPVK